jgi:protocatechuate 3,4-dioxygenase alpha subunit
VAGLTPFQTVGPYLHLGLLAGRDAMTGPGPAASIVLRGRLVDGEGRGLSDGVLEFWAPGFASIGRVWTGSDGGYRLDASKPAARVEGGHGVHAPHFGVRVLARGILTEFLTRVYFDDEPENARDVVLQLVPEARRATVIAATIGPADYRFDIVLQGEHETVFFDV